MRRSIYIAQLGLSLTLDRGTFERVAVNPTTHAVRPTLSPAAAFTSSALIRVTQPASVQGIGTYRVAGTYTAERGGLVIPLQTAVTTVEIGIR